MTFKPNCAQPCKHIFTDPRMSILLVMVFSLSSKNIKCVKDLGSADKATRNGSANVAAWRGGPGQVVGFLQAVQGYGARGG